MFRNSSFDLQRRKKNENKNEQHQDSSVNNENLFIIKQQEKNRSLNEL